MLAHSVIEEDHKLERAQSQTSEALAKHRWHWTLDETNPKRVSIADYAQDVGRGYRTIHEYAHAYRISRVRRISAQDALQFSHMDAETAVAAQAVAKERGVSLGTARTEYPSEVHRVRDLARDEAERKGTSVEREAPTIAKVVYADARLAARTRQERLASHTQQYFEIERCVIYAMHQMERAVHLAHDHTLPAAEVTALQASVDILRGVLDTFDRAITKRTVARDWDTELKRLTSRVQEEK